MNGIYNTDSSFAFDKLNLAKPHQIPGGSFFIRLSIDNNPLYIQPPVCKLKQGILKAGKKYYSDFMFTNENSNFIEWMEHLENYCQAMLFENRNDWFEGDMEMHDIENYFTSPLKIYKSGKYYLARVNITTNLGNPTLKIYNEEEQQISIEDVNDKMNIMSVLEIKGIKCSSTCFQLEMDIKQMMTLKPNNIFDRCVFKSSNTSHSSDIEKISLPHNVIDNASNEMQHDVTIDDVDDNSESESESKTEILDNNLVLTVNTVEPSGDEEPLLITAGTLEQNKVDNDMDNEHSNDVSEKMTIDTSNSVEDNLVLSEDNAVPAENIVSNEEDKYDNERSQEKNTLENTDMQEVDLTLDEIPENESFSIKNKNNVYYEMYKEAKRKAKVARDMSLSSYLEAKRIKNVYMLQDSSDSEDSDYENIDSSDE